MTPFIPLTPRLAAEIAAIVNDARSTPMTPRGDLDDWLEGRVPRRPLTQRDIDVLRGTQMMRDPMADWPPPRDRRERDGEAFDVPPLGFGHGLVWGDDNWGGDKPPRQPRDWPEILGSIAGAAIVVGVAAFLAWMAARGLR